MGNIFISTIYHLAIYHYHPLSIFLVVLLVGEGFIRFSSQTEYYTGRSFSRHIYNHLLVVFLLPLDYLNLGQATLTEGGLASLIHSD